MRALAFALVLLASGAAAAEKALLGPYQDALIARREWRRKPRRRSMARFSSVLQ